MKALTNARVLTQGEILEGYSVAVDAGRIHQIAEDGGIDGEVTERHDLDGQLLLPGFIDVQVNGGGGVLFNDAPTVETIRAIGAAHRKFGTTGFLPTLISDDLSVVEAAIAATDEALRAGVPGLLGIHLEGPFLNPDKKGAHDASKFRVLDDAAIELLTTLKTGKTMVTIAPETTDPSMIRRLADAGVIVSAGHTNATYEQVRMAIEAGLSGFTHLFNAMSPLTSREPGVVGAALEDRGSWCGVIVDGHHVSPATMRIAMTAKPLDRFVLVTDAMPSVGWDGRRFELGGKCIEVVDGRCVSADGTLSGSHLDMASAVRNALAMLNLDLGDAVRMASRNPAEFLGLGSLFGQIEPGYAANLVLVDDDINVVDTWIDGNSLR